MSSAVRVRFAPSPTGYLHVGGARTAAFTWLYARHTGGKFILRLLGHRRRAQHGGAAMQAIYGGLRWLGLDWDEGPLVGGDFGPYFQSRAERNLLPAMSPSSPGGRPSLRGFGCFALPLVARRCKSWTTMVCGRITFDLSDAETHPDMTIRRPDGSWIFHFVNVVDDLEMGITHVIRGEDHLCNTPKQSNSTAPSARNLRDSRTSRSS